jgi:hypothetical protein
MPFPQVRLIAYDPDGKRHWKSYSTQYFSQDEILKLGKEWQTSVEQGDMSVIKPKPQKSPEVRIAHKQTKKAVSDSDSDSENDSITFILPKKNLSALTMPDEGGCSALFLGSTRAGKTTMIKSFHDMFFNKHITVLHTHSPQADIYNDLKKKTALVPRFCPEIIDECMMINQKTNNKYDFLHIIDDCVSSKNDKMMIKLLTIGRNSGQSVLISGQELSILNSIGRSNINFVFCGKLGSDMAIKKAVESYLLSIFPTDLKMPDKIKLYKTLTADYHWIVLDAIENRAFLCKINI